MNPLAPEEVQAFIERGFVRLDEAFPRALAAAGRAIMWRDLDCEPDDPATWMRPVIRLDGYGGGPFDEAANGPRLRAAFDQIVGKGRWRPRSGLGAFPVRFPCPIDPDDTGWHIDVSIADENSVGRDYSTWRTNVYSRGRALLLLFLFSDVTEKDAPTRIRIGSHLDLPRLLEPFGEAGLSLLELEGMDLDTLTAGRPETTAIGPAGTVYLCHPFLVHAAQPHRGITPRFLAQPELQPAAPVQLQREDGDYSPVEMAIRRGLVGE